MIAITERRSILAIDDDQRASIRDGKLLVDWRIESRIFMKIFDMEIPEVKNGRTQD